MQWRSLARKRIGGKNGWSLLGATTILAIVSVLVLVSFSRLRDFILAENEQDALAAVRMMTALLDTQGDATTIHELVEAHGLEHRLADASFPSGSALMQRHGYYFEICALPGTAVPGSGVRQAPAGAGLGNRTVLAAESSPAIGTDSGSADPGQERSSDPTQPAASTRYVVRAWPCVPGESGSTVLVGIPGAGTLGHANPERSWGGPARPPTLPAAADAWSRRGWRRLP